MSTHTPGPWYQYRDPHSKTNGCFIESLVSEGRLDKRVALVMEFGSGTTPQECDANARLIAAAPRLLEALAAALDEHHCDWNGCWCDNARAILRDVEGA